MTSGLVNNAGVTREVTSSFFIAPTNAVDAGFYIVAVGMGPPTVHSSELKGQYDALTAESNQRWFNYAYGPATQCLLQLYWLEGTTCAGAAELERETRATSVRHLKAFYREHYGPDNAVLVLVGDISRADALSLAKRYFGVWPRRAGTSSPRPTRPPATTRRATVNDRLAPAARLDIAYATVPGSAPEFAAANVLSTLLGRGGLLRSKLVDELRLFTRISTSGVEFRGPSEAAPLIVTAVLAPGIDPDSGERAISREMLRLAQEPVASKDLERAKGLLATEFLRTTRGDRSRGLAYNLGYYTAVLDRPELINSWLPMVEAVTSVDLMSFMKRFLVSPPSVVVATLPLGARPEPGGRGR